MKESEIIEGNAEICEMLGWQTDKVYMYKVPNLFPSNEDSGWIELNTQAIGFHVDWNMLIGAYNKALLLLQNLSQTQKELFESERNFIVQFGTKHFFGLFENQLHISSSWIKLVDFSKWYNSVKLFDKMLNSDKNSNECDTTKLNSSNEAK